jgi:hypothetical protein
MGWPTFSAPVMRAVLDPVNLHLDRASTYPRLLTRALRAARHYLAQLLVLDPTASFAFTTDLTARARSGSLLLTPTRHAA